MSRLLDKREEIAGRVLLDGSAVVSTDEMQTAFPCGIHDALDWLEPRRLTATCEKSGRWVIEKAAVPETREGQG